MKKLLLIICKLFGIKHQPEPTKPKTLLTYKQVVHMLREYDNTRFEILVNNLGFEDTRVNTFDFAEMKNYLAYTEELAHKKGIKLKGISFVKGVYNEKNAKNGDFVGYENLLYLPTALVNGKEMLIDLESSSRDKIVTLKEKLSTLGYEWKYDNKNNFKLKTDKTDNKQFLRSANENELGDDENESLIGNWGNTTPPYHMQ
ncbi:hypothetical protein ACSIGC_08700 [Tenacibaculum sp. ZS6-P6]|uniref:hypothetical protein n=1 Tax=Tenacibaculum sp. ZS6-P6 TaxID=3447503 RepID=UPI003F97CC49